MLALNLKHGDYAEITLEDGRVIKVIMEHKRRAPRILVDAPTTIKIKRHHLKKDEDQDDRTGNPS